MEIWEQHGRICLNQKNKIPAKVISANFKGLCSRGNSDVLCLFIFLIFENLIQHGIIFLQSGQLILSSRDLSSILLGLYIRVLPDFSTETFPCFPSGSGVGVFLNVRTIGYNVAEAYRVSVENFFKAGFSHQKVAWEDDGNCNFVI